MSRIILGCDRAEKAEALVKELKSEIEDMTQRFHDEVESRRLTYIENKKLDAELLKRAEARVKELEDYLYHIVNGGRDWLALIIGSGVGAFISAIIWICVDDNVVTNMERKAIELGYATYVDGRFTWKKEQE